MYQGNVLINMKTKNDEVTFDELDEDYIAVTALEQLTTTRTTNSGRVIGSSIPRVPYELKTTIPPTDAHLTLAQNFYDKWKQSGKPEILITIQQVIDEVTWTLNYNNGMFTSEIDQDVIGSKEMPKFSFTLAATGVGRTRG